MLLTFNTVLIFSQKTFNIILLFFKLKATMVLQPNKPCSLKKQKNKNQQTMYVAVYMFMPMDVIFCDLRKRLKLYTYMSNIYFTQHTCRFPSI